MTDWTDPEPMDEDVLSAYLDGELDFRTRVAVLERLRESAEWRDVLDEVRSARLAVRGLEPRQAPAGFWDDVLAAVVADDDLDHRAAIAAADDLDDLDEWADAAAAAVAAAPPARRAPVPSLDERRRRSAPRWAALAASAAAAVMLVLVVLPSRDEARPPVATFTDAHAARSSLSDDPVSQLAGVTRTPQVP